MAATGLMAAAWFIISTTGSDGDMWLLVLPALLILFAVLPPAVLNYMFADRYGQQPEIVAAIVIWGNLASLLVVPLTLALVL